VSGNEVAILAIICGTGIALAVVNMVLRIVTGDKGRDSRQVLGELRGLREEMNTLKQSHEVILSFDSTVQTLERRVTNLERCLTSASQEAPQTLRQAR